MKDNDVIEPEWITLQQALTLVNVCENTLRKEFKAKRVVARKWGSRVLVELSSLRDFIARLPRL